MEIVTGDLEPYTEEPLESDGESVLGEDADVDLDELTTTGLEARLEHRVAAHE